MVTGASTANVALILVDASKGLLEQSRRHAFIASLMGVPHLVICVNKLDLVGYAEQVFQRLVDEFSAFAAKLEVTDLVFIPISALHGDNVVERSPNTPWYDGTPLLYHLEHVHIASDRNLTDVRFPVQWVIRPLDPGHAGYRAYAGQLASGLLKRGDDVVILPSGLQTRIAAIEGPQGEVEEAEPPLSLKLRLEDELDVSRGDLICRSHNQPVVARAFDAVLCWLSDQAMEPGRRYVIRHTTREARAVVHDLHYRIDVNTLHRADAERLVLNEIGRVTIKCNAPLLIDEYRRNRETGAFILIDEASNDTVAAGMVMGQEAQAFTPAQRMVTWHAGRVTREQRAEAVGQGATVWFTGLSASGKSTISVLLEEALMRAGRPAYLLDGDNLRHGLNADLGFDSASRAENVRRAAEAARLFADAGMIAVVSLISPYRSDRALARAVHSAAGLPFIEVFVDTPLEVCERRDPKGLYAKARAGELKGFTGIDDPYERPENPDILIDGAVEDPEGAVVRLMETIESILGAGS
jgi:bifunctional enzyme CysN/CysC